MFVLIIICILCDVNYLHFKYVVHFLYLTQNGCLLQMQVHAFRGMFQCSSPVFADLHRSLVRVGPKVWASRSGRTYAPLWLCTRDSGRSRGSNLCGFVLPSSAALGCFVVVSGLVVLLVSGFMVIPWWFAHFLCRYSRRNVTQ